MCETFSTYGGEERYLQGFWWGNLKGRGHLEHTGVDGRIILSWIFKNWNDGHGLDWWLRSGTGHFNAAINLPVP
jgi:hypothetical protein